MNDDLPHPADIQKDCMKERPLGFTSYKQYNVWCDQTKSVFKGYGNGFSLTSQEEADQMATLNASIDANNKLGSCSDP